MDTATHEIIIEVLATAVETITRKYNKRGHENHEQAVIITNLDTDVVSLSYDVGIKDAEIERLKGECLHIKLAHDAALAAVYSWVSTSPEDSLLCNVNLLIKLLNETEDRRADVVKGSQRIILERKKSEARARKSESEKRAYMRIVKEALTDEGTLICDVEDKYKAWQKEQKKA